MQLFCWKRPINVAQRAFIGFSRGVVTEKFEHSNCRQRFAPSDSLYSPVKHRRVGNGLPELLLALLPLPGEGPLFGGKLFLQGQKRFDHGLDVLAKLDAAKMIVKHRHFLRAVRLLNALSGRADEALTQRGGEGDGQCRFAHPHSVGLANPADPGRRASRNDHGEFRLNLALVSFELFRPVRRPVPCALCFPKNCAALQAGTGPHALDTVGAPHAFLDLIN